MADIKTQEAESMNEQKCWIASVFFVGNRVIGKDGRISSEYQFGMVEI